jgi:asparaginyl-tRNA synthetase
VVPSQGKKQRVEIQARAISLISGVEDNYPISKGRISLETLRTMPHLRPRTNSIGAVMRLRSRLAQAIHRFFDERDFCYINTPIITASDCEGAGEMFKVTTNGPHDFFNSPAHLTVSGQLEAEAFALSLGKVYTFGPTFRAENSHTSRHLSEFWMVEPEVAFNDIEANMRLAEEFLKSVIGTALERCSDDIAFFDQRIEKGLIAKLEHICSSEFIRLSYTEAIDILHASKKKFQYPLQWGCDLQSEHERYLCEEHFCSPVILIDYPAQIKPFYMYCNDDGKTVRGMDVLVPGVGEIIGGSERETRLDVITERMRAASIDCNAYQWYLDLRRHGSAPHAGFGLGFERLVQFVSGMGNIRDVIPYPRTPGHL